MGRIVGLIFKTEKELTDTEPSKFEGMDVEQLKAYAQENGIDIGQASSANGIIKKITDAEKETK